MNKNLYQEIKKLLEYQKGMKLEDNNTEYILSGTYQYSLQFKDCITQGEREIKLVVQKDYPNSIPKIYFSDYPEGVEHIYQDGSACLATIGELIQFLSENSSLMSFIDRFVNSFIFTLDWFEKYKTYPFGDRAHGYKGLLDYYLNDLGLTKDQYNEMLFMINDNKYRGHSLCFCGSDKKLRNCHGKLILPIIKNENYKRLFLNEAYTILTKDGKNVSK